ncbi:hypothetical protein C0J52_21052 [Blattella germanica]|nr:hypothetical protein C0J52_21052 [Blattella germanica]
MLMKLYKKQMFFTVFIDFSKAFDLLTRDIVIEKHDKKLGKKIPIIQSNGVLQGDPMSRMLKIPATEVVLRIPEKEEGIYIYAYADDIVIGSTYIQKLQ